VSYSLAGHVGAYIIDARGEARSLTPAEPVSPLSLNKTPPYALMSEQLERGETLVVLRHGRPIAEVSPVPTPSGAQPSWKRPPLRLTAKGASLSSAILSERNHEVVS
jgi:antitoxin (DNA-binding transcriptional repressor) of toxin-antitoxin stability system